MNKTTKWIEELKADRRAKVAEMSRIMGDGNRRLTTAERQRFDTLKLDVDDISNRIASTKSERFDMPGRSVGKGKSRVTGNETSLTPRQSFRDYAEARGMYDQAALPAQEFDWDAYWCAKFTQRGWDLGQNRRTDIPEMRYERRAVTGMGEDLTSGAGAGSAVVAQIWAHNVIDIIRAKTFGDRLNVTTIPMATEIMNLPTLQNEISPVYIAEQNGLGLDVGEQLSTIQLNASGAFADIVAASKNIVEDAVNTGGIDGLIKHSIAMKYARLIDQVSLYGQTGSPGNPGLLNESSLQTMNVSGAPTTYVPVSQAAAKIRAFGAEPSGVLMHPSDVSAFAQLQDTLHQPLRVTPDVAQFWPPVDSSLLNFQTETGSSSSFYVADWSYMMQGIRLAGGIEVSLLDQRFAEFLQVAWLSRMRFSVRSARVSQVFCQAYGMTTPF